MTLEWCWFLIEGCYRSGSQILSIRPFSCTSCLRGFISLSLMTHYHFIANEMIPYIHRWFGLHNCQMTLLWGPRSGSICRPRLIVRSHLFPDLFYGVVSFFCCRTVSWYWSCQAQSNTQRLGICHPHVRSPYVPQSGLMAFWVCTDHQLGPSSSSLSIYR